MEGNEFPKLSISVLRLKKKLVARLNIVAVEFFLTKTHFFGAVSTDHVLVDVEEPLAGRRDAERFFDDLLELEDGHVDADRAVSLGTVEFDGNPDLGSWAQVDVDERVELAVDGNQFVVPEISKKNFIMN